MRFGEMFRDRSNNLSLIRVLAAILVILHHSLVLTMTEQPFGMINFGAVAVYCFFFYGGILILKSAERKKNAKDYFRARCLRIFPSLWIVVLLTVFVSGPLLSALPFSGYFGNGETYRYLLNMVLIPVHTLPGVFQSNPYGPTVNGSLWTLPVEFVCYILCFVFCRLGFSDRKKALYVSPLVVLTAWAAWFALGGNTVLQGAVLPVLFFYLGMLCYIYRDQIPLTWYGAAAALVIWALTAKAIYWLVTPFALSYVYLYLGFGTRKKTDGFMSGKEISYGIYLAGFPVQQSLISFFPGMPWYANFLAGAALSAGFGWLITLADQKISRYLPGRENKP